MTQVAGRYYWVRLGNNIYGETSFNRIGLYNSLSFNEKGDFLSICTRRYESNTGVLYVYRWNGLFWIRMGESIIGEPGDFLGNSVSMNNSGNRICISSNQYTKVFSREI